MRDGEVEFYLLVSAAPQKNRIVSSILGIKAKPSVIVSTILTAAGETLRKQVHREECVGVSILFIYFLILIFAGECSSSCLCYLCHLLYMF